MSTKVKIDKDNTGYDTLEIPINERLTVSVLKSCPNGEKIIVQVAQIVPKRVSRTFAQENQNEIDNF